MIEIGLAEGVARFGELEFYAPLNVGSWLEFDNTALRSVARLQLTGTYSPSVELVENPVYYHYPLFDIGPMIPVKGEYTFHLPANSVRIRSPLAWNIGRLRDMVCITCLIWCGKTEYFALESRKFFTQEPLTYPFRIGNSGGTY